MLRRNDSLAAGVGLVGGSIEDATGDAADPVFEFGLAVERVAAAAEEARKHPFILTARAENFLCRRADLDDTIRRLVAFEEAGADVLYAPGLPDIEAIRTVCSAVKRPVNVVMGLAGQVYTVEQLQEAGVKRISVGGSFARAALAALMSAAREVKEHGTFTYAKSAMPAREAASYMLDVKSDAGRVLTRRRRRKRQSNRLDTDSSWLVRLIASPSSAAVEITRILCADCTAVVGWIESVITSSFSIEDVTRATAPPERTPWVI